MTVLTYPITDQRGFDEAFNRAFADRAEVLLGALGIDQQAVNVTTASATVANDPSTFILANSGTAQTITINKSMTNWKPGQVLTIIQLGAGAVTVAAGTGATINKGAGFASLVSAGQYSVMKIVNVGADKWVAFEGFTAAA